MILYASSQSIYRAVGAMGDRRLLRMMCEPHADLTERAESYLTMVDQWASRGNAARLKSAVGSGKLAAVAALAAER